MRSVRLGSLALAAALSMSLAACGGDDEPDVAAPVEEDAAEEFPEGSVMAELANAGEVTVGTKFDQPLFGLKGLSGEPEGFDIEVAKIIAAKLGIQPEDVNFVETVSANREPFLEQEKVDYVVATYTINEERDKVVDFAGPYFLAGQDILVKKGNPLGIEGPEDLAGKKVCSVSGSTPASKIAEDYPEAELVLFDAYTKCRDALQNDQVDAVTTDNVILSGYVEAAPDEFELVGEPFTDEPYGIGVPEGQEEFCEFINETLQEAAESGALQDAFGATAGEVIERDVTPLAEPWGCGT
jgi:glutamate transport system substrate-binding protein